MQRNNVVTWVDGRVITKFMAEVQRELMEWQVHAYDAQFNGKKPLGGDSPVVVSMIQLRGKLDEILGKHSCWKCEFHRPVVVEFCLKGLERPRWRCSSFKHLKS